MQIFSLKTRSILLILMAVVFPACGNHTVTASLQEWEITLNKNTVKSGEIDFEIRNSGKDTHEIVFVKLDADQDISSIPRAKFNTADAQWLTPRTVGELEDIEPGQIKKISLRLQPGRYLIICNILEKENDDTMEAHFDKGMHSLLIVN